MHVAAGGLCSGLLGVPPAGSGLRSSSRAVLRVHSSVGLSGFPAIRLRRVAAGVWRSGRGGSLGRWEASVDQSLYAVWPLGAQALLEGNRRGLPHFLGPGVRRGRVCGRRAGASHAGVDPRIGVDEIQYAKGHKYLTLVYQIDQGLPLAVGGKERTIESFQGFFTVLGEQLAGQMEFVCSDMWQPYLDVIRQNVPRHASSTASTSSPR